VIASGPPTETVTTHDHPIVLNQGVLDMGKPRDKLGALTQRELEVLELVTTGMSDFEIARWLNITSKNVVDHMAAIYSKLRVTSQGSLARQKASDIFAELTIRRGEVPDIPTPQDQMAGQDPLSQP
jgi:DNA-binding NarL/FixJ family response regulator